MNSKTYCYSLLFIFFIIFYSDAILAQEKNWEVDLKEQLYKVNWIKQSNDGGIIAAGDKGLLALDNETGETRWHNEELKAIDKNSFLNIDGLPLFYIDYQPVAYKTRGLIINASNGDIVFDTKDEGYRIKTFTIYPEQSCILFEATKGKEQFLMKFSLKTWEQEWLCNIGEVKGLVAKVKSSFSSFIKHGPYFTSDGQLIIGMKTQIMGINFASGELVWQEEADKRIKALVYSELNNKVYLGVRKSKKLTVLDPSSGADITPGKLKLRGSLLDVRPDENNNLILVETEGFNLIDPKSETFVWKKSFKIDYLDEVIPYGDQYIAIGKDEKDGSIALVTSEGKKVWDAKVKGYAYYVTPTDKGVMYISTERSNILEYEKGKDLWKKDVKFKSIPAITYDEKEKKVIIFENKNGYKFGLNSGEIELFAEDIKLVDVNKKTPLGAEYVEGGYFIGTDQHASLLSPAGQLVYSKHFEPVTGLDGLIGLADVTASAALGVDLDIQGNIDNINTLTALSNGSFRAGGDQGDGSSSESTVAGLYTGSNDMQPVFEVTKKRYYNSKDIKGYKFIVTKVKNDGGATSNFIYQLNKSTGNIDKQIQLTDKTPDYIVDEVDSRIFLNEKNQMVSCFQL